MLCSWREFSFDQLAEQKGGWGRLVKHPGLVHRSASLLKSREKFLPGRCNQRLCRCMPVSADNHCRLFHFFQIGSFDDVYHVKATQRGKAFFPCHSRTLALNLLRHILGQGFEVLGIIECARGNATENHECRHIAPLMQLALIYDDMKTRFCQPSSPLLILTILSTVSSRAFFRCSASLAPIPRTAMMTKAGKAHGLTSLVSTTSTKLSAAETFISRRISSTSGKHPLASCTFRIWTRQQRWIGVGG